MSRQDRQDEIAAKAVRKSTLTSLKVKKAARLRKLKNDYEAEVQKINLEYAKEPERLKAKYAAEEFARNERSKKRAAKRIERYRKEVEVLESQRKFSLAEEIASSIIQGIGALLAVAVLVVFEAVVVNGIQDYKNLTIVLYTLFGACTISMYVFSVLHHALTNHVAKEVFKRLSHAAAFLMIGLCYSAYAITKVQGVLGWVLFGIVVGVVLVGIILYSVFGSKFEKGIIPFYVISGFAGLIAGKALYQSLSANSFGTLAGAGALFIIALVFYLLRKAKWMHFVGNVLMLFASVMIYNSIILSLVNL